MTIRSSLQDTHYQMEHDADTGNCFAVNYDLGVVAQGSTDLEAVAHFREAVAGLVSYCLEENIPLPRGLITDRRIS